MVFGSPDFDVGYVDTFGATETYEGSYPGHFKKSALTRAGIDKPGKDHSCRGIVIPSGLTVKMCRNDNF